MLDYIGFLWPVLLIGLGFVVGRVNEQRHIATLDREEAEMGQLLTLATSTLPGITGHGGALVSGSAVIATDYFKTFAAGLRSLVGGEVKSYSTLMDRARRQARVRLAQQARQLGAVGVVNLRYQMNDIGGSARGAAQTEILCYGTAILPHQHRASQ